MGEGRDGRGAKSSDGEKALSSKNQSITSGFNPIINNTVTDDMYLLTALRSEGQFTNCMKLGHMGTYVIFLFL